MRTEQEVALAIERYADMVRRICMLYLKNTSDTEDIFQEVFLKYALYSKSFTGHEHEKAWVIRVTINQCKDLLKSFFRSKTVSVEELLEAPHESGNQNQEVLRAVLTLPQKYKEVVYLHYYEGYTAVEIGQLLKKKTNTVYTLLARAKALLRESLSDEYEQ